ncbi:hypothetical protein AWM79_21480 [Pseudomonas agarici]|uniref:Uncharacterized protein n=1 Tax=Pseudomonas agarici TaxID=46677 RepID=A0A0X1T7E4_PSEAA|nr:hypothetical protein [Pseudomonas agarici]AMB87719.1 hypothetical protein AWM79_21480 [Pseudomonas agarici]
MLVKSVVIGFIGGMVLSASAIAEISNKSGDFDVPPKQDMLNDGFMCKSADVLFEFYEKVPASDQDREKFAVSFLTKHYNNGDCWHTPPSSAYLTGFRFADVKRLDRKLPSLVIVPRVVVDRRLGYVIPSMIRMNLPDLAEAIKQKNKERGWPVIQ